MMQGARPAALPLLLRGGRAPGLLRAAQRRGAGGLPGGFAAQIKQLKRLAGLGAGRAAKPAVVKAGVREPTEANGLPEGAVCYCEKVRVGHRLEKIHALVADVDRYEEFLPWCLSSSVDKATRSPAGALETMEATIGVGFSLFKQVYRSSVRFRNAPGGGSVISARLEGRDADALLEFLECEWSFARVAGGRTDVDFEVVFRFRNPLHNELSSLVQSQVVQTMVRSFNARLEEIHGPPAAPLQQLPLSDSAHARHNAPEVDSAQRPSMQTLLQLL